MKLTATQKQAILNAVKTHGISIRYALATGVYGELTTTARKSLMRLEPDYQNMVKIALSDLELFDTLWGTAVTKSFDNLLMSVFQMLSSEQITQQQLNQLMQIVRYYQTKK